MSSFSGNNNSRTGRMLIDRHSRTWDREGSHYYDFQCIQVFTDKDGRDELIKKLKDEGYKTKTMTYTNSVYGFKEYAVFVAYACTCLDFGKQDRCLLKEFKFYTL